MVNLLNFDPNQFLGFFLILTRISGVMAAAPIFGDATTPVPVKSGFALILSLVFYPLVAHPHLPLNPPLMELIVLMTGELAVGLLIGLAARLLMVGIELAGELIGFQTGLGMAHVFDPLSAQQVSLFSQVLSSFALLILVMADGHHLFIEALANSYKLIGTGEFALTRPAYDFVLNLTGSLFVVGIQVGAPLVAALLAANLALGLVARSVPQMNVFVVGVPLTIGMGILFLGIGFPFFIQSVTEVVGRLEPILFGELKALGG
ncbi:MAG: flagellar biosynthetic protein FliR [Deltaproteobacteria bacterium]|nr:flagellar biosynthetic protein FliR [Deltaproteobacteria bacterium]